MKNSNRTYKNYIGDFVFFFILYVAFGYYILSMTNNKTLTFYISLLLYGVIYGLICSAVFSKKNYNVYIYQLITIPLVIASIALNFKFLSVFNGH